MLAQTALTWSWLNILTKKRYDALIQAYGDLDEALRHVDELFLKGLGCRDDTVPLTVERLKKFDANEYEKDLKKREISLMSIEDESYPKILKEVPDCPVFLYFKGDIKVLEKPCIACVGTRRMSSYGKRAVEEFVPVFVRAGMTTVSGLAQGIDAQVARSTLDAGGGTVAVLGHGLAEIYPKCNSRLADEILEMGGLVLSEFPLDQPPDKYTFPSRNRIIAGLSLGTIVFEAGEDSGALITSDLALDYGREVFAVPGQIFDENFRGCHQIISKGNGKLVSLPVEVLGELGMVAPDSSREIFEPEDQVQGVIYSVLTGMPQSIDDIMEKSALQTSAVNTALTMLELNGAAKNAGGGMWVRV